MTIKQLGGVFGRNPTFNDVTVEGTLTFDGALDINSDINLPDNKKITFGADNDLQIYHDGNNSYIEDAGVGVLNLKGDIIRAGLGNQAYFDFIRSSYTPGSAGLRIGVGSANQHEIKSLGNIDLVLERNDDEKLRLTSTGIDVTGSVVSDGLDVLGPEQVTNGTFDTGTTGWTSSNDAVLSIVSGKLRVTNGAASFGGARQTITTEVGKAYVISYEGYTGGTNFELWVGSSAGSYNLVRISNPTSGTANFVATGTSTYISLQNYTGVLNDYAEWDNISVKQIALIANLDDGVIVDDLQVEGNLELVSGNLVVASGSGIDFSATAGTGTSELFDDYEEGTWTPQLTNATGPTTPYTMSNIATPRYTKIGRMVHIECWVQTTNVNTAGASGDLRIAGLPFAASSSSFAAASVTYIATWAGDFPSSGIVEGGSTLITLRTRSASNGADAAMDAADLTSGAGAANVIALTASYTV